MIDTLSAVVKQHTFQDAKNTSKDSCLLGPPSLEFAPYGRVPGSRVRKDGRQGTIDQDPEFIDFLQSLTKPVIRSNLNGEVVEGSDTKPTKITTTPLVEYLKEKKANKGKEASASKGPKSQAKAEPKDAKAEKTDSKKVAVVREVQQPLDKSKPEKLTQDSVKIVTKSAAATKGKTEIPGSSSPSAKAPVKPPTPVKRERERVSASVAAKILQRDLGLTPTRGERRTPRGTNAASRATVATEPEAPTTTTTKAAPATKSSDKSPETKVPAPPAPPKPASSTTPIAPPTGPRIDKQTPPAPQTVGRPLSVQSARPSRPSPSPSPGAKSAFLKHANFSQGVTEDLLRGVFSTFGTVTGCEIDRKKGFGYVYFEDTESLKKAMLASPVKVGDKGGQVVVLENKNPKTKSQSPVQQSSQSEGKPAAQPQNSAATSTIKVESTGGTTTSSTVTAPPIAPRGVNMPFRGGAQQHGPRGGFLDSPRGGFNRGGRGGKANFRGRGTFESNRGGGRGSAKVSSSNIVATSTAPAPAPAPASVPTLVTDAGKGESG